MIHQEEEVRREGGGGGGRERAINHHLTYKTIIIVSSPISFKNILRPSLSILLPPSSPSSTSSSASGEKLTLNSKGQKGDGRGGGGNWHLVS